MYLCSFDYIFSISFLIRILIKCLELKQLHRKLISNYINQQLSLIVSNMNQFSHSLQPAFQMCLSPSYVMIHSISFMFWTIGTSCGAYSLWSRTYLVFGLPTVLCNITSHRNLFGKVSQSNSKALLFLDLAQYSTSLKWTYRKIYILSLYNANII